MINALFLVPSNTLTRKPPRETHGILSPASFLGAMVMLDYNKNPPVWEANRSRRPLRQRITDLPSDLSLGARPGI